MTVSQCLYLMVNSDDVNNSGHTGAQLRVAAYGPGAINIMGLTDQTDIFKTITKVLDLKD